MAKFSKYHARAAKLRPDQVLNIRKLYHEGNRSQASLSREFGVTEGTIGRIVRGTSWQAYGGPGGHLGGQTETEQDLLHEAVVEQLIETNPLPADDPGLRASLALTLGKLGMTNLKSKERTDDLPRQTNDVLPPDGSRLERATDRPSAELPVRDLPLDKRSEAEVEGTGREPGQGPGR